MNNAQLIAYAELLKTQAELIEAMGENRYREICDFSPAYRDGSFSEIYDRLDRIIKDLSQENSNGQ